MFENDHGSILSISPYIFAYAIDWEDNPFFGSDGCYKCTITHIDDQLFICKIISEPFTGEIIDINHGQFYIVQNVVDKSVYKVDFKEEINNDDINDSLTFFRCDDQYASKKISVFNNSLIEVGRHYTVYVYGNDEDYVYVHLQNNINGKSGMVQNLFDESKQTIFNC